MAVHRLFVWALAVAGVFFVVPPAFADLLVAPTRLVFEAGARHGEFTLVNKGDQTERYRISLEGRRMEANGRVVRAEEPGPHERFAHELIRFAPRMVVLPPNDPQTVRIMIRNPGDLPAGEYRSHLVFLEVPEAPPAAAPDRQAGPGEGLSVSLTPIFGISVPIIVRHGELKATGLLSDLGVGVERGQAWLRMHLAREGERSLYGEMIVHHEAPGQETREVGRLKGVALYTPNRRRSLAVPLDELEGRLPERGRLLVEYRDAEPGSKHRLLAEASLGLGP